MSPHKSSLFQPNNVYTETTKLLAKPSTTVKYPADETYRVLHLKHVTFPNPSYWLCTTPRSGSSALGDALARTGVAGRPTEYFNRRFWPELSERFRVETVPDFLEAATRQTATPNGVFGVKVMLDRDMEPFFRGLQRVYGALPDTELVQAAFPNLRFVYLTRRNKVRQAVSFVRAQQTGVWARYTGEAETKNLKPEFDSAALNRSVHDLALREVRWQDLFGALGASPYTVVYEDYVRAPEAAVRGILDFLGLEPPADWSLPELPMERLADEVSDAWVKRYLEVSAESIHR